jgi:hypothetical protein
MKPAIEPTMCILRFCVDELGNRMILTECAGCRVGRGSILRANEAGRWKESLIWIS